MAKRHDMRGDKGERQEEEYEVDEGEPLPKVDVLVLPGSGSVDFDPLLSALQSPVRSLLRVFPGMLPAPLL